MGLAEQICEFGRIAYERGLLSGHDGNLSVLLDDGRLLCTASGVCKGRISAADLCEADLTGAADGAGRRVSSEILLHAEIFSVALGLERGPLTRAEIPPAAELAQRVARSRVRAVLHTHAPYATTFALLGESPAQGFLAESELLLGYVPVTPYETPGTRAVGIRVRPFVCGGAAALLANHGAVTWGRDLEEAFARTEALEAACRVLYQARLIGSPRAIPADRLAELRAARAKYMA